jgi:cleavage stimulation factor subunit 2
MSSTTVGSASSSSSAAAAAASSSATAAGGLKHDIFVGNLAFNTTEEQLSTVFSECGKVVNVRMVTDPETGKLRGFAFVEFEDPQAALVAIRNMNEYELNGRKLRVNFSNSSHLEALAGKLGMDLSSNPNTLTPGVTNRALLTGSAGVSRSAVLATAAATNAGGSAAQVAAVAAVASIGGTQAIADSLKTFTKGEMYDVLVKLKEIADRDIDEARRTLTIHPQLPEAILFLMSKLDMIKNPAPIPGGGIGVGSEGDSSMSMNEPPIAPPVPVPVQSNPSVPIPGTAATTTTTTAVRVDPRQRVDPRARPNATTAAVAPPPPLPPLPTATTVPPPQQQYQVQQQYQQQQQQQPPPPPAYSAQSANASMGGYGQPIQQQQQRMVVPLDPGLVQQVMSLTPLQIQQLPPDKQQSILQLRQQITGTSAM